VWADDAFPACGCAQSPVAALRVSKQAATGGQWFFGCRGSSAAVANVRCNFFQWAPPHVVHGFGDLLSPLT
jgi:hypothetical protein